jgi:hypothetical protein
MNRFLLGVIALLLILALIGHYTSLNTTLTIYRSELVIVAENVGIIMMLVNGTFISTRLFKVALFILGLIVLGFLFKIMHIFYLRLCTCREQMNFCFIRSLFYFAFTWFTSSIKNQREELIY